MVALEPPAAVELVARSALVHRLVQARAARLAAIVAPPGYGKSTLIAQWASRDERPFYRLVMDAGLGETGRLIGSVGARGERLVLVIDPADRLEPGDLRALVQEALRELPDGSCVALASRTEPPLPLGRLRAQRMLVEVRTADLRMDSADAALLLRAEGASPSAEELAALVARTDGWPAALLLAASAAKVERGPQQAVFDGAEMAFDGAHHHVYEYVRDEVLSPLPAELVRFAIRTSVLDELAGLDCDAVLERRASAQQLARLASLTPLLMPADRSHRTFRWHRLVREALLGQLRRSEPELELELHARAGDWYRARGDTERALAHAAAAGSAELVERLLSPIAFEHLTHGRQGVLAGWLETLGPVAVAQRPPLALYAALAALASGRAKEARRWAQAGLVAAGGAGRRVTAGPEDPIADGLRLADAVASAGCARALGEAAESTAGSLGPASGWAPFRRLVEGVSLHLVGDGPRAAAALDDAICELGDAAPSMSALALAQRAMIALEDEEWELAAELTDRARAILADWGLELEPLSALVLAAAAASRARQGRADEAKADLRRGIGLLATSGEFRPWYDAASRILLAHASLRLADVVRARALLADASRQARRVPDASVFARWFDAAWARMDSLAETSLSGPSSLTIAELRVLRFLPSHRSFREIGAQLSVSGNTVKTQAHAIYRKLGVASRSEAVARATEAGLLG